MIDRRTALSIFPVLASGALLRAESKVLVVDTHLHCFAGTKDTRFPYHKNAPYQPVEPATPEQLLKCMGEAGFDHAIVVHPEPYQDDHRYLKNCLRIGSGKLKGTCLFFADQDDSIPRIKELCKEAPIVAARIHAYNPDRLPPFEKPELTRFWKAVGDLGLAIQLHFEPRYAKGFEKLISDHPKITVLIDHLGRPYQGTKNEYQIVLGWSRYPNVIMKLSSVPDRGKYPHRDPADLIKDLTQRYGGGRLMFGGGFHSGAKGDSYRAERERVKTFLDHLPESDVAEILGGTAQRIFKLES